MGSLSGPEAEEIARLEAAIDAALAATDYGDDAVELAAGLITLRMEIQKQRERYWKRTAALHRLRQELRLSS
jgi:hypothetical protein